MRVFLDTNVLASSIATRGLCAELFESVVNEHELLTCEPVFRELERVLADKFRLPDSVIKAFISLLKTEGSVIKAQDQPLSGSHEITSHAAELPQRRIGKIITPE